MGSVKTGENKMKRKMLCFALVLMMCFGLSIPALAAEDSQYTPKYGRDPNNYDVAGRSAFVTDGEYFYYISHGGYSEATGQFLPDKIVKQSIDGQTQTFIYTSDVKIGNQPVSLSSSFNLMDGYLYFKDECDNIYRLKTDGTFVDCIFKRDPNRNDYIYNIRQMLVIDDRLYLIWANHITFQNDLISMKLDGSDVKTVENKNFLTYFVARGEWLYFGGNGEYFCYNIHTGATKTFYKTVGSGESIQLVGFSDDGRVHYTVSYTHGLVINWEFFGKHYSSMPDGSDYRQEKELVGNNYSYWIVGNDYLYYADDGYIYKSSLYDEDTPIRITDKAVESRPGRDFGYHNGFVYVNNCGVYKVSN